MKIDDNSADLAAGGQKAFQEKDTFESDFPDIPSTRISVFINSLRRIPQVRWDKVKYLKALVQNGEYENEARLKGAAKKITAFLMKD